MPLKHEEAEKLIEAIRELVAPAHQPSNPRHKLEPKGQKPNGQALTLDRHTLEGTGSAGDTVQAFDVPQLEELYQAFKARLLAELPIDPIMLHVLATRPEIVVDVERQVLNLDASTIKGRIAIVAAGGYMNEPRSQADIRKQMERTGPTVNTGDLSKAMRSLLSTGIVVVDNDRWTLAPGVKVTERSLETR